MSRRSISRIVWAASLLCLPAAAQQPAADPKVEQAQQAFDQADQLARDGKADQALAVVQKARQAIGTSVPWLAVRGLMLEARLQGVLGNWSKAESDFAQVVDQYFAAPDLAAALAGLGRARRELNRPKDARAAYERIITDCPHSYERYDAAQRLVELDLADGKLEAAAQRLDGYVKAYPWASDVPWLLGRLGQALLEHGQPQQALARFTALRSQYAGSEAAFNARRPVVECNRKLQQYDAALAMLNDVAQQAPGMFVEADAVGLRADVLVESERWQQAVTELGALAQRFPQSFVAVQSTRRQAALLAQHDDVDGAVAKLKQLAQDFPAPYWRVPTLRGLFTLLRAHERWDDAEDTAAALVDLTENSPTAANTLLEMAEVQRSAGRKRAARLTLAKVAQTYKGAPVVPWAEQLTLQWDQQDKQEEPK